MYRPLFEPGDIVQHFKRETIKEPRNNEYLYKIVGFAQHTETGEALVIYKALYGDKKLFARPKNMFYSEVDHEKYPNIKQCFTLMDFKQTYFSIWQEIWNLHKKYAFISKDDIPQWENLTMEAKQIHDKYSDSAGAKFAEALLIAVTAEIDRKAK